MDCAIIPETEHQMIAYLRSSNCCFICCLRLIGTRTIDIFRNYTSDSKSLSYISEFGFGDDTPCTACLGILQCNIQELTSKQIIDAINSSGFDSSTFTCALSVPVCLSLRERYLQICLSQKFNLSQNQLCHLKLRTQSIKELWKIQVLPKIEAAISKQHTSGSSPSPFSIDIIYNHVDDESDCKKILENYGKNKKSGTKGHHNNSHSRNYIEKLLNNIEDEEFMKYFYLPSVGPSVNVTMNKINCFHRGIFIGGRYNKLSRYLSQTPWYINGAKKMETSVQDLLCHRIVEYTKADTLKFLSSGREDVDVRTINQGRPFAVELVNPRVTNISAEKLAEIVDDINASTKLVKITSVLKVLLPEDLKKLKEGENIKTKCYRALCLLRRESKDTIDLEQVRNIKNIKIIQKTPIRVLHRRPLTPRIRVLHEMRARWLTIEETTEVKKLFHKSSLDNDFENQLFIFDVKTQAGTYVKEFVHGDFGRTRPNLCDILGAEIDIVALDVTSINIDWP